jgi:CRISPR system Cascade subunit CasE
VKLANVPMTHPVFAEARWGDAAWQHRSVMRLFGDLDGNGTARSNAHVLFRVEPDHAAWDDTVGRVLVQSSVAPAATGLRVTNLAPLLSAYEPGMAVQLLLRANTVRTINRTGSDAVVRRHRARIPEVDLAGWFTDRLAGAVEVQPPVLTEPGQLRRGKAQLITTTFRANAIVQDPQQLALLVRDGVGRAKAYGCGMISALPLS